MSAAVPERDSANPRVSAAVNVWTIPPHRPFADMLVAGILSSEGRDPVELARGLILLPNNRAARAVHEAFVRARGGAVLLPRLVPVGDPELGERVGGALEPLDETAAIPPAIGEQERLFRLARLVRERVGGTGTAEAMRLAADLARTLDALNTERVEPARLREIAADTPELAQHWQRNLEQLSVLIEAWPRELERLGRIDMSDRRNRVLAALRRRWRARPPGGFVIAGGVTVSAPAVGELLGTVARMARGHVVLPALDLDMPEPEWESLGGDGDGPRSSAPETHPQYHLRLLLDRMSVARGEVQTWRARVGDWGVGGAPAVRSRAIAHAMAPAWATAKWQTLPLAERRLTGVRALEAPDPGTEAQAVALAIREAINTPGKTVALVTPDRQLARRVSAHLRRWDIEADDSAGRPLAEMPPGTLLLLAAQCWAERLAPVPLLALLRHPLVQAGDGRGEWLAGVRTLDLALRGPRPAPGLGGLRAYLSEGDERSARVRRRALDWLEEHAAKCLEPLDRDGVEALQLAPAVAALRATATALCGDAVWSRADGRAAADLLTEVESASASGPPDLQAGEAVPLLDQLLRTVAVRPAFGGHPRVRILGLIEARLQSADLTILSGLNEGTWPQLAAPDAWLAPKIRAALGLPGLDRRVGLSAHDFATSLGASEVLVTRSRRDARAPAVASRLWLRLEAMTGGMTRAPRLKAWARELDQPAAPPPPAVRPAPVVPAELRPKRIAVTAVDRLRADPFAFYAGAILRLPSLDMVDAAPSPAWRGSQVHLTLQHWMEQDACDPAALRARGKALLEGPGVHPIVRALWQPRLLQALGWMADTMAEDLAAGRRPARAEAKGEIDLSGITLHGRADRIDRLADGRVVVLDYKTGQPPKAKAIAAGYSMQLGLLGLIAERGGFDGASGEPAGFEYWSLARGRSGTLGFRCCPDKDSGQEPAEFVATAKRYLDDACARWLHGDAPFTSKLHPEYAPWGDYDHLARVDEWWGREA